MQRRIPIKRLTYNGYEDALPQIDGNYVLWHGGGGIGGNSEIYLYNIGNGQTTQLTSNATVDGDQQINGDYDPQIDSKYAVWTTEGPGGRSIILHTIAQGSSMVLPMPDGYYDISDFAYVSGEYVIWQARNHSQSTGGYEIFRYDILAGTTQRLTDNAYDDINARLDGPDAVWQGNGQVYVYNGASDTITQVSLITGSVNNSHPDISNGIATWKAQPSAEPGAYEIYLLLPDPPQTAIPEPATFGLVICGCVALVRRFMK